MCNIDINEDEFIESDDEKSFDSNTMDYCHECGEAFNDEDLIIVDYEDDPEYGTIEVKMCSECEDIYHANEHFEDGLSLMFPNEDNIDEALEDYIGGFDD